MSGNQVICGVIHENVSNTNAESDIKDAVQEMRWQLNNDPKVDTTFYDWFPDYEVKIDATFVNSEVSYVEGVLWELWDEGYAAPGDVWIIVDGADLDGFGYGQGNVSISTQSGKIHGARVLHTPSQWIYGDPYETFINLAIHEIGHTFEVDHWEGSFALDEYGISSHVSPMATAYAYLGNATNDWSDVDTCSPGFDTPPNAFCDIQNQRGSQWCSGCQHSCRHDEHMSLCTKNTIDVHSPR